MPEIRVYAELLLNLRQVTVFASLQSAVNKQTSVEFSSDRQSITLQHEGVIARLQLPAEVAADATFKLPNAPVKELSFRLPISGHGQFANLTDATVTNGVPWSAEALTAASQISCRACNQSLTKCHAVAAWKNLPSQNWADMMDFWHCHKPDHEDHNERHVVNGSMSGYQEPYHATGTLLAKPGTGFVDPSYLLLSRQDCSGIKVRFESFTVSLQSSTLSSCLAQ